MDRSIFSKNLEKLQSSGQTYKRLFQIMAVSNILIGIALLGTINKEKIILVPQVAPEMRMWISQSQASPEYFSMLTRNALDLLLNVSASNIDAQQAALLNLVSPKARVDLKQTLISMTGEVKANNISQNFYIESIKVIINKNEVFVMGRLNQYIDKNNVSTTQQYYKITYQTGNYNVFIKGIELLDPNSPELKGI